MTFLDEQGVTQKYYRGGVTSTQTSEIVNGAPGAARSFFGGFWRYRHPVSMVQIGYNWYTSRFKALREVANSLSGQLTPAAQKILNLRLEKCADCRSTAAAESVSAEAYSRSGAGTEICSFRDSDENTYYRVNLRHGTCECNMFQEFEFHVNML
jgi:hypothetical protein